MKGFGKFSLETGHKREPEPPESIVVISLFFKKN